MQVGDLVKLYSGFRNYWELCGTVSSVHGGPKENGWLLVSVLWNDGKETDEYIVDLEAIC
jgi:hypothetical protein